MIDNHESTSTSDRDTCETVDTEWSAPSLDEQSACAEICAYVFTE